MNANVFTDRDLEQLRRQGLTVEEAGRQLRLLADPPPPARLDRACTPDDGIERLDDARIERLLAVHALARDAGRVTAFVPASGAASRMFKDLLAAESLPGELAPAEVLAAAAAGSAAARALAATVDGLPSLAAWTPLREQLAARGLDADALRASGPWRPLLAGLVGRDGLDLARRPKGLLPFHATPAGPRTAFEEHFGEAAALARDAAGNVRLHVTVSPEHRADFESLLARVRPAEEAANASRYDVSFSEQQSSTDTLAAAPGGGPFRDDAGALLFRPAGHGALLHNLDALGADLLFLRNIDNVAAPRLRAETSRWACALLGLAAELTAEAQALRVRLDAPGDATAVADATRFVRERLREADAPASREALADQLDRPLRVAGMVRNTGEPGGGPFWVVDPGTGRASRQVVESAQVSGAPEQQAVLRSATHFNPVFIACALRDRGGRPWPLARFVDERAVIVTAKSHGGRELLALERPGLWNGAMARWNTVFVEVPLVIFNPVKTLLDLLRPEHLA